MNDDIHTCNNDCQRPACVAVREAVAAEREECAKILDVNADACAHGGMVMDVLRSNAAAIRARGAIMTDKQPEALRLADALEKEIVRTVHLDVLHQDALNELRRLHEVNAELVEALKFIADHNLEGTDGSVAIIIAGMLIYHAKEALAKATGEQQ